MAVSIFQKKSGYSGLDVVNHKSCAIITLTLKGILGLRKTASGFDHWNPKITDIISGVAKYSCPNLAVFDQTNMEGMPHSCLA